MANFWDIFKTLFGFKVPGRSFGVGASLAPELEVKVKSAIVDRVNRRQPFTPRDIAEQIAPEIPDRTLEDDTKIYSIVLQLHQEKVFQRLGYTRTWRPHLGGNWIYHPIGDDASSYVLPPRPSGRSGRASAPREAASEGAGEPPADERAG